MGRGIWLPGGGGADLDVITAAAGDILDGKVIVDKEGNPLTGSMVDRGNWNGTVGMNGEVTVPGGKHGGGGKVKGPTVTQRGAWTGRIGINGKITIPEGYHNGDGYAYQSEATKGSATYTPGTSNQTIAANQWLSGAQTISGDANLKPENIRKDITIFGKKGVFQGMVDSPYYLLKSASVSSFQPILSSEMESNPRTVTESSTGYDEDDWKYWGFKQWFKVGNSVSAGASRLLKFNKTAISFAAYSKLYIKITSTSYGTLAPTYQRLGVSSNGAVTGNSFQAYIDFARSISNGLYELNISALNDTYWIYLWQQLPATGSRGTSGSCLNFYEMYLQA